MEQFIEMSVGRKNSFKDHFKCFVFCILPILFGSYLMVLAYSLKNTGLLMVAIVISALLYFLSYKIFNSFSVEYEYSVVDDEIRFAKIINKSKRRELVTINRDKIKIIARVNDSMHKSALSNGIDKRYSLVSQTNDDYYFMVATVEQGKTVCVFFEPNDKMCENFRVKLPHKFFK